MERIYSRDTCRLCGSRELNNFLPLAPSPVADAYIPAAKLADPQGIFPVDLCLCERCGHVQLLHIVEPEDIYVDYLYVTKSSPGLVAYYGDYAKEMADYEKPAPGSLVIDIGSNDGALLRAFKALPLGLKVLGVDPAHKIAAQATAEGLPTIPEFLTPDLARRIVAEHGPARMVTANNIVANVDDLPTFFEAVRILLAPDGVFVLESGYWADIVDNMLFDTVYHEHLSYFAVLPLLRFVENTELMLVHAIHTPSKGGCLRYVFAKRAAGRKPSPELLAYEASEHARGLDTAAANKAYADIIDGLRTEIRTLLADIRAQGKTIACYGASNTTTTLFYHFGLADFMDYMVDDNPIKQGLYSPGLHLPVHPSAALYEKRPDYVFVAAWRFWRLIVERHPEYAAGGGQWIIPLPRLEVRKGL
jgi:hypothetical protein